MSDPEQYRNEIEKILKSADLATITTKKVRLELEKNIGQDLGYMKQEINQVIENAFANVQKKQSETSQQRKEDLVVNHEREEPKKAAKTPIKTSSKGTKRPAEKRKRDMPLVRVLPPLSNIINTEYCSRTQTVSKMWEYIREHNLQNEENKKIIECDDYFKELCGGLDRIDMFSIPKYIQKYMEKLSDEEQAQRNPKKDEDEQPPKKKVKRAPRDMPILQILPPLSDIIKTEYCSRTQSVSKIWEYIKEHNLQNPEDKRLIDCDEKFKELCDGISQVSSFALNKYTQKCFVKISKEEQPIIKKKLEDMQEKTCNNAVDNNMVKLEREQ
ncbi:SWIB/MDM2 domain-containing protein [Sporodiniella umbellata]|nr:SWIB/MDM2 domain-containing protein [Sporodiniella umbellata]